MIVNFACKETEKIWQGEVSRRLPQDIQQVARRKLRMLNNANSLEDLRLPPSNRLEKLKGDRANFYSLRVNDQWRLCFRWHHEAAHDVIVIDYH